MTDSWLLVADAFAILMVWVGAFLALLNLAAVFIERAVFGLIAMRRRRVARQYAPVMERAMSGDQAAIHELAVSPVRLRVEIARLLLLPLIDDHDAQRIASARTIFEAMSLVPVADRLLHSRWWWQRALGSRVLGFLQMVAYTPAIVAALDDRHPEVRAAALDALADLRHPDSLQAVVVRLHDESLHRGRRLAALTAFGSDCEPFLLEMAAVDSRNRLDYARALRICGTARSLSMLAGWTQDPDPGVRAAAFEALAHVGPDARVAPLAIGALESDDVGVRAMAAYALHDCSGASDVAGRLAQHLDDQWQVAVQAARSLKTIGDGGITALKTAATRSDLAGQLARQTLWEIAARC